MKSSTSELQLVEESRAVRITEVGVWRYHDCDNSFEQSRLTGCQLRR
jgi:hypothetical protein